MFSKNRRGRASDGEMCIRDRRWMNSGMMWNGKCLTAKISEYHKTGNVCSLSDILEENVDEKFFLSEEKTKNLVLNG